MPAMSIGNEGSLYYEIASAKGSEASTVVLIHGLAESGEAFREWMPHFQEKLRVVRPDLRGYGRSSAVSADHRWCFAELVSDMGRLLDHIGGAPAHVVGAKIGGTIAMQLAADRPELVRSLSVVGAPASLAGMRDQVPGWREMIRRDGVEAWAQSTMTKRMGTSLNAEKLSWWIQLMGRTRAATLEGFLQMVPSVNVTASLPKIEAPTLIITTSGSGLGSVDEVRRWQETIPDSRLHVIDADSYHVAGSHPDECAEAVLNFIGRVDHAI